MLSCPPLAFPTFSPNSISPKHLATYDMLCIYLLLILERTLLAETREQGFLTILFIALCILYLERYLKPRWHSVSVCQIKNGLFHMLTVQKSIMIPAHI